MRKSHWLQTVVGFFLLTYLLAILFAPIISGDDAFQALSHLDSWIKALRDRDGLATWTPGDANNYGSPLPFFYHKAFNVLAAALSVALNNPNYGFRGGILIFSGCMFFGMYLLSGHFTTSKQLRAVIATVTLYSPYAVNNLVARTAVAEFSAMALVPFAFTLALNVVKNKRQLIFNTCALMATFVILALSHIVIFLATLGVIALGALAYLTQSRRAFVVLASTACACLLFLFFIYIPFAYWGTFFSPRQALIHGTAADNTLSVLALFCICPGSYISWTSLALFAAVYFEANKPSEKRDDLTLGVGIVALAMMLIMTTIAAPLWRLSNHLNFIQFPWRLLAVSTPLVFATFAGAVTTLSARGKERVQIALLTLTLLQTVMFFAAIYLNDDILKKDEILSLGKTSPFWNPDAGGEYFPAAYASKLARIKGSTNRIGLSEKPSVILPAPTTFLRASGACHASDVTEPRHFVDLHLPITCDAPGEVSIAQFQTPFLDIYARRSDGTLLASDTAKPTIHFSLSSGEWIITIRERSYLELVRMAWEKTLN